MQAQLMHSVAEALKTAWVLDCDTTIKPLYGHQAGAELGYNRINRVDRVKPFTPTGLAPCAWVADAQLESGKRHAPSHSRPGLVALLDDLAADSRPQLVRGDVAFGSEGESVPFPRAGRPGNTAATTPRGRSAKKADIHPDSNNPCTIHQVPAVSVDCSCCRKRGPINSSAGAPARAVRVSETPRPATEHPLATRMVLTRRPTSREIRNSAGLDSGSAT